MLSNLILIPGTNFEWKSDELVTLGGKVNFSTPTTIFKRNFTNIPQILVRW